MEIWFYTVGGQQLVEGGNRLHKKHITVICRQRVMHP